ncbi:2Fe-2S iron-sulfur cluster binding domain-containing protein [Mesorhizobium sp. SARCC-RB16n]|uniref:2Fe-2S iron-sulfur cluster-binding protein n=1 Tax=Mesorhizobium sp. SARCC-RB16n TaxID=2116687 RepID=UPI001FED7C7E|nr:2Fe-2S iron-sulfur cluster binding domain-containing protein [Mesorhizobium sp. SARCC-RB16n]
MLRMTDELVCHGVPRFEIFAEGYTMEIPDRLRPCRTTIAGTHQSFEWTPAAGSILDVALAAGAPLPSGCRVGQCESCAIQVVDGSFAHLIEFDGEPGRCLTCHAVPLSDSTIARNARGAANRAGTVNHLDLLADCLGGFLDTGDAPRMQPFLRSPAKTTMVLPGCPFGPVVGPSQAVTFSACFCTTAMASAFARLENRAGAAMVMATKKAEDFRNSCYWYLSLLSRMMRHRLISPATGPEPAGWALT